MTPLNRSNQWLLSILLLLGKPNAKKLDQVYFIGLAFNRLFQWPVNMPEGIA